MARFSMNGNGNGTGDARSMGAEPYEEDESGGGFDVSWDQQPNNGTGQQEAFDPPRPSSQAPPQQQFHYVRPMQQNMGAYGQAEQPSFWMTAKPYLIGAAGGLAVYFTVKRAFPTAGRFFGD